MHRSDQTPVRRTRLTAQQRRESILTAAVEVFAASGYRAGKVSDVAAKVGVTEPVVFQNFGSKAALFAAVLDRAASDTRCELDGLREHGGSATELLAHVLDPSHDVRRVPSHGPRPLPLGPHGVLFADATALTSEPALTEPATRAVRAVADHLADIVRRGQADGDIRADLDAEAAAWLLLSVLSTRPLRAAAASGGDIEDGVAALAIQALLTPARRRRTAR